MTPREVDACTVKQVCILLGYDEAPPPPPVQYQRPDNAPAREPGDTKPRLRRVV